MTRTLTWSYGGGTQSIALAILVRQGRLPRPAYIGMANTGREAQETFDYHQRYVAPMLAEIGLVVDIIPHDYATVDLYGKNGDLLMPMYTAGGKLSTFCSNEWKQRVFRRRLRELGYTSVRMWLGMSLDEVERLKHSDVQWIEHHWPLCFDVPMTRGNCADLVRAQGWPAPPDEAPADWPSPPKSSCWCCPHRRNAQWRRLRDYYPAEWEQAIALDSELRARDTRHDVYLHYSRLPLGVADIDFDDEGIEALPLFGCDSGVCWT